MAVALSSVALASLITLFLFTYKLLVNFPSAVAYFWMHAAGAGSIWWWSNRGELVMIYSFVWLLFAAWGAGPYSVDAALDERGKA